MKLNNMLFGVLAGILVCSSVLASMRSEVYERNDKFVIETYDHRFGCINSEGNVLIEPIYKRIYHAVPYIGTTVAWLPNCLIVFDELGEEIDRLDGRWISNECLNIDERLLFAFDGNDGVLYDYREKKIILNCSSVYQKTYMNETSYLEYIGVCVSGKWGYIKPDGEVLIGFQFEDIRNFHNGYAPAKLNGKWGVIDTTGSLVLDYSFDWIDDIYWPDGPFVVAKKDEKYGLYDRNGNQFLSETYAYAYGTHDRIFLLKPESGKLVDLKGNIIKSGLDFCLPDNGNGFIVSDVEEAGKYHIDLDGNALYKQRFHWASTFHDGLASVQINSDDSLKGYINRTGKIAIKPKYTTAKRFFGNGLASVKMPQGDKVICGYINTEGEMVIKIAEDTKKNTDKMKLGNFYKGLAFIRLPDKMGYINTKGEWVWMH